MKLTVTMAAKHVLFAVAAVSLESRFANKGFSVMSGSEFAAIYDAVSARLTAESPSHYGRAPRHAMGACPVCKIIVCITHHDCKRR